MSSGCGQVRCRHRHARSLTGSVCPLVNPDLSRNEGHGVAGRQVRRHRQAWTLCCAGHLTMAAASPSHRCDTGVETRRCLPGDNREGSNELTDSQWPRNTASHRSSAATYHQYNPPTCGIMSFSRQATSRRNGPTIPRTHSITYTCATQLFPSRTQRHYCSGS